MSLTELPPTPPADKSGRGGRRRPSRTPKGRQVDPQAVADIEALLTDRSRRRDLLIEHLHLIQDKYGHISAAHLAALAAEMKMAQTEVYEVATFYAHFDVVKEGETPPPPVTVRVCDSLSCAMAGAERLLRELPKSFGPDVRVVRAPCMGACDRAPVCAVGHVQVMNAAPASVTKLAHVHTHADALKPGAGFPTGRKWSLVRAESAPRLMAVNADEGEPGTFKDRYYLGLDPHRFLEGMLIAAWVVEAAEIYIYIRDEYPELRLMLVDEIEKLEAAGLDR